jgi:trypsin
MNIKSFYHIILAALTSQGKKAKPKRVIGGTEAIPGRHSYAVSLVKQFGSIYCGGSLIAPDVVLSAAHCAGGSYAVLVGTHDLHSGEGDEVEVSREIVHPEYDTTSDENDFMVLILVSRIFFI